MSVRRTGAVVIPLATVMGLNGAAAAAEVTVTMVGGRFAPQALTVSAGDTIRFVNDDLVDHNVFVPTRDFAIDLGKQEPGKSATLLIGKAGRFEVECVIHPDMAMTVEVRQ